MPRKISSKGAIRKADDLFSQLIRSIGYCEHCGRTSSEVQLQCAHWIGRRFRNTRWDPDNAFSLCAGCHMWFTDHPTEFGRWAIGMRGEETYQRLREAAEQVRKLDVEDEIDILEQLLEGVEV